MQSKPLRILHAYKRYHPYEGGIPAIIKQIAEGLQSHTHQKVLTANKKFFGTTETINNISIQRLGSWGELYSLPITPHYPLKLWQLAKHYDIVDYHFPMPWVDIAAAAYWPKKTKLIIHWHSNIVAQAKLAKLLEPAIQRCLKLASHIVVADESYIAQSSHLTKYQNKCVVIPFGVNVDYWQSLNDDEQTKVAHLRQQHQRFILAVGRLVPYKGFPVLIKAMQQVMPDFKLVIVGRGPLENQLRELAKSCGVADRIQFCGRVNDQDLKYFYHAAELFVLPSVTESEAFGLVQLEAMACAKPIVNTQLCSAVPTVASHGKEALTVSPNSPDELAQAINQILLQPHLAHSLGLQGLQRVRERYSEEDFTRATLDLYHRVSSY